MIRGRRRDVESDGSRGRVGQGTVGRGQRVADAGLVDRQAGEGGDAVSRGDGRIAAAQGPAADVVADRERDGGAGGRDDVAEHVHHVHRHHRIERLARRRADRLDGEDQVIPRGGVNVEGTRGGGGQIAVESHQLIIVPLRVDRRVGERGNAADRRHCRGAAHDRAGRVRVDHQADVGRICGDEVAERVLDPNGHRRADAAPAVVEVGCCSNANCSAPLAVIEKLLEAALVSSGEASLAWSV